ncbi:MAG: 2-hydroxyacid dehydrogenase [Thermoleophilaceae bacterium]
MARVLVTRRLPGTAVDRLSARHEVELWPERLPPKPQELRDLVQPVEGLLVLLSELIDRELLDACPLLRAISNYAVGTDNVDLEAATARGIPVGNTPDVLTETTADLTLALMLAIARRVVEGDGIVREGGWVTWEPSFLLGRDLHDATVGIVGYGRIGQAVASRVESFGCRMIHTSRHGGVPLEALLEQADFVTLHCPLSEETRGLIDDDALGRMKPTAYLVNTARGPIVDTMALGRALRRSEIAGAALDVTDPEPISPGHPLLDAPNLVVVPHVGSATHATREAMAEMAVDNLLAALAGERMPHCANPEVYEDR